MLIWNPGGDTSTITVHGSSGGAVPDIHLSARGCVEHRRVVHDDHKCMFPCELTVGKPIVMRDCVVIAATMPDGDGPCVTQWSGRRSADSTLNAAEGGQALKVALGNMTTGIVARLKGTQPVFSSQPNEDWQLRQENI